MCIFMSVPSYITQNVFHVNLIQNNPKSVLLFNPFPHTKKVHYYVNSFPQNPTWALCQPLLKQP